MTLVAGLPWAKIIAFGSYSTRWAGTPVQSRTLADVSVGVRFDLAITHSGLCGEGAPPRELAAE
jgi:hypothetical protein